MPPPSLLRTLFLLSAVAGSAIAELTFTATAKQGDREIPSSEFEFVRTTPRAPHRHIHGDAGRTETGELGKRDLTVYGDSWSALETSQVKSSYGFELARVGRQKSVTYWLSNLVKFSQIIILYFFLFSNPLFKLFLLTTLLEPRRTPFYTLLPLPLL